MTSQASETVTLRVIRELGDARTLLAELIRSSESFDYPKAKLALAALEKKIRELGRMEASLRAQLAPPPNVLTFPVEQ